MIRIPSLWRTLLVAAGSLPGLAVPAPAGAQPLLLQEWAPFEVREGGEALDYPFFGGWHNMKPHFIDIDADGDLDILVVRVHPDDRVTLIENVGTAVEPRFDLAADRIPGVHINSWIDVVDFDGDGDFDILSDGRKTILWHENVGDPAHPLFSTRGSTPALDSLPFIPQGVYARFPDMDLDGDRDYLWIKPAGGEANYQENIGSVADPLFAEVIPHWGGFDTYVEGSAPGKGMDPAKKHGNSSLTVSDVDLDGLPDLLIGDLTNRSLWYFRNNPQGGTAHFDRVTKSLLPDSTLHRNFSDLVDIDGDGVRELFICPEDDFGLGAFRFYERDDERSLDFFLADSTYLHGMDIGVLSRPAIVDLDGDGRNDIVMGGGEQRPAISFYRNTGSAGLPRFDLVPPGQSPFQTLTADSTIGPLTLAFGDLDADGDFDCYVGNGYDLLFYENVGTAEAPSFLQCESGCVPPEATQADTRLTPALGDVDSDGDLDLFLGEWGNSYIPNLFFFRNDGNGAEFDPVLISDNRSWDLVDVSYFDPFQDEWRQFVPTLEDMDYDGRPDLLLGFHRGEILFCRNRGEGAPPLFGIADSAFSDIDVGGTSAPATGDIDGDGDVDLVVGEEGGGLNFFRCLFYDAGAEVEGDGSNTLSWKSGGGEAGLAFHVYRGELPSGPFDRITAAVLPHSGSLLQQWNDRDVDPERNYFYRIEAVLPDTTVLDSTLISPLKGDFALDAFSLESDSFRTTIRWSIAHTRPDYSYRIERNGVFLMNAGLGNTGDGLTFAATDSLVFPGNLYTYALFAKSGSSSDSMVAVDSIAVPLPAMRITNFSAEKSSGGVRVRWEVPRAVRGLTFDLYASVDPGPGKTIADVHRGLPVNAEPIEGSTEFSFFHEFGWFSSTVTYTVQAFYRLGEARAAYPDSLAAAGAAVSAPLSLRLLPVRPHPFTFVADKRMRIAFDLPRDAVVGIRIYNLAGRLVRELAGSVQQAGPERALFWDGRNGGGEEVPTGYYFIRVDASGRSDSRKVLVIRD